MRFQTDKFFTSRENKAGYVYDKYQSILTGSVLDVGADECYLKNLLPADTKYIGVGLGGHPDIEVNLEQQKLPFEDNSFDCVLCMDVLEHLDNIHDVFDDLCRVSKKYVIISLPNCYRDFLGALLGSAKSRPEKMKYYGLPLEKQMDRHKWFFSSSDSEAFIRGRAAMNRMKIVQIDHDGATKGAGGRDSVNRLILIAFSLITSLSVQDASYKTGWFVLEKVG